tara:strand:+ start:1404 stop:3476 length:2073 start_codon:yes stop_codon:yes gene_type:complete
MSPIEKTPIVVGDPPEYWASEKDPDKLAEHARDRVDDFIETMKKARFWSNASRNWNYYHGLFTGKGLSASDAAIEVMGRDGQLRQISLNHFHELIGHMLNLVTQNRPAFETEATRTDHDALKSAELGDAIVNDYLKDKGLEKRFKRAVEHALVMQMGFIYAPWDWNVGKTIAIDQNADGEPRPLKDGDFVFSNPSIFDVYWDYTCNDWEKLQWVIIRSYANKFDLAARASTEEEREEILNLDEYDVKEEDDGSPQKAAVNYFGMEGEYSDLVPIWEVYHLDCDAMPGGLHCTFTSDDKIIGPVGEMPYKRLPLFRITPEEFLLTSFGYSRANDLQAPQEALNQEMSTILTNHSAAGVQAIWVPTGCELDEHMVGEGVLIVEGGQIPPQGINFAKTPKEFFNFRDVLSQSMEQLSGVNSVARGQPEASLRTGEALKVLDSKAVQAGTSLLQSYYDSIEEVGTFLLRHLPVFMNGQDERVVRMVGRNNRAYARTFQKQSLEGISNVRVQAGNALSKTVSGRLAIADKLLEHGFIRTQEQYLTVLNSGQLKPLVESDQSELDLIRDENERLDIGQPAYADPTDNHVLHIREHKAIINKVERREDPAIVSAVYAHILEHVTMLDQIPISRIQMALGYQVPYPPFAMQGPDEATGGQGGGGAAQGQTPAVPGEPAAPGQNFEQQQSNASPVPEAQ